MKLNIKRFYKGAAAALLTMSTAGTALAATGETDYQPPSVDAQRRAVQESVAASPGHGVANPLIYKILIDRLERDFTDKGDFSQFEGQGWLGSSTDRLWLKAEAKRRDGSTSDADLEAYYSHAIAAYWDAQIGVRHDFSDPEAPSRDWLAFSIQGLAPYKFETSATAYVGKEGRTAARLSGEYDFFITQRLIFWPQMEVNLYGKNDPERGLGSGLSDARLALRWRYEIRREFAPYIGIQWTHEFGETATYSSNEGRPTRDTQIIAGLRVWW